MLYTFRLHIIIPTNRLRCRHFRTSQEKKWRKSIVILILGQRRKWPNIKTTLAQRLIFTVITTLGITNIICCRSGNFREVLIFANLAEMTNSRIQESHKNYFHNSAILKKNENLRILNFVKNEKSEIRENLNTRRLQDIQYIPNVVITLGQYRILWPNITATLGAWITYRLTTGVAPM